MRHHESSRRLRAVRLPVVVCITLATLSGVVLQAAQIPAAQARGTSSWSVSTTSTSTDGGFLDGVSCPRARPPAQPSAPTTAVP